MTDNPDETLPVELLPCPFCGDDAAVYDDAAMGHSKVCCSTCGAEGSEASNDDLAADRWNTRAAQSPPPVVSEGVEHDLLELLAVIHRDGGHYVEQHGIKKAVADAMQLSSERLPSPSRGCDLDTVEACAKACEQQMQDFLSPEYATGQPLSSVQERIACKMCADRIRNLATTKEEQDADAR